MAEKCVWELPGGDASIESLKKQYELMIKERDEKIDSLYANSQKAGNSSELQRIQYEILIKERDEKIDSLYANSQKGGDASSELLKKQYELMIKERDEKIDSLYANSQKVAEPQVPYGGNEDLEKMIIERDEKIDYLTSRSMKLPIDMRKASIKKDCKLINLGLGMYGSGEVITKILNQEPHAVILQRKEEKTAFREIIDSLATRIDERYHYEGEHKRLEMQITALINGLQRVDESAHAKYTAKFKDVSDIELKHAKLRADNAEVKLKEVEKQFKLVSEELLFYKENHVIYENTILERDMQLDLLTKKITNISEAMSRLAVHNKKLQLDLDSLKQELAAKAVTITELNFIIETKEHEIEFQKEYHEEAKRSWHLLLNQNLGSGKTDFHNELSVVLGEIRLEYESYLEAMRTQDTEAWYRVKFNEVISMITSQTNTVIQYKEEALSWRTKYHDACAKYYSYEETIKGLEIHINQLTVSLEVEQRKYAVDMDKQTSSIIGLKEEIAVLLLSLKELTDVRLSMEKEIMEIKLLLKFELTKQAPPPFTEDEEFYRGLFQEIDANKSGHVTATELKLKADWLDSKLGFKFSDSYLKVDKFMHHGDDDKSLTLDFKEFCRLMKQLRQVPMVPLNPFILNTEEEEFYRGLFKEIDANKSGHVTTTELKLKADWVNAELKKKSGSEFEFEFWFEFSKVYPKVNEFLHQGDATKSLTLDFHEFCCLMQSLKGNFIKDKFNEMMNVEQTIHLLARGGIVCDHNRRQYLEQHYHANGGKIVIQEILTKIVIKVWSADAQMPRMY